MKNYDIIKLIYQRNLIILQRLKTHVIYKLFTKQLNLENFSKNFPVIQTAIPIQSLATTQLSNI